MSDLEGSRPNGGGARATSGMEELRGLSQASLEALGRDIASSLSLLSCPPLGAMPLSTTSAVGRHLAFRASLSTSKVGPPMVSQTSLVATSLVG